MLARKPDRTRGAFQAHERALQSYLPFPSPFASLHTFTHSTDTANSTKQNLLKTPREDIRAAESKIKPAKQIIHSAMRDISPTPSSASKKQSEIATLQPSKADTNHSKTITARSLRTQQEQTPKRNRRTYRTLKKRTPCLRSSI